VSNQLLPVFDVTCCVPLGRDAMTAEQAESASALLKAIADPVRLRLMSIIAASDETCVCELSGEFDVSQPTISHHLRVLREAGWVDSDRRGTWVYYRPRRDAIDAVGGIFARSTVPA
jgi:ArsR family transcriptional regulator